MSIIYGVQIFMKFPPKHAFYLTVYLTVTCEYLSSLSRAIHFHEFINQTGVGIERLMMIRCNNEVPSPVVKDNK